jgi:hypothetical protein
MTRDEIRERARFISDNECPAEASIMALVDDATKELEAELAICENRRLIALRDSAKARARIAELEAALEAHAPNDPLVIEAAEAELTASRARLRKWVDGAD